MNDTYTTELEKCGSKTNKVFLSFVILGLISLFFTMYYSYSLRLPPNNFPVGETIEIKEGLITKEITQLLKDKHVVRSSFLLSQYIAYRSHDISIKAGIYTFNKPLSTSEIASALVEGTYSSASLRLTIPEGMRSSTMSRTLHKQLPHINEKVFESLAKEKEGYLFPDTYFIPSSFDAEEIIQLMSKTFEVKIAPYKTQIEESPYTLEEIITMASILEREANDEESMRTVAGILWKRIELGMPLQADATLEYLNGKVSEELTEDDLKIDSPYNTYLYRGLPPTPISNPGVLSIESALSPTPSPYLYYLTGLDGNFYYAETFDEHKRNKEHYLR